MANNNENSANPVDTIDLSDYEESQYDSIGYYEDLLNKLKIQFEKKAFCDLKVESTVDGTMYVLVVVASDFLLILN